MPFPHRAGEQLSSQWMFGKLLSSVQLLVLAHEFAPSATIASLPGQPARPPLSLQSSSTLKESGRYKEGPREFKASSKCATPA